MKRYTVGMLLSLVSMFLSAQLGDLEISSDSDYTYSEAKVRFLSIPSGAFHSVSPSVDLPTNIGSDYQYFSGGNGVQFAYGIYPIHLPEGARITKLIARVWDSTTSQLLKVQLRKRKLDLTESIKTMAEVLTTNTSSLSSIRTLTDTSISFGPVVDNEQYTYHLRYQAINDGEQLRFYNAVIEYEVTKVE